MPRLMQLPHPEKRPDRGVFFTPSFFIQLGLLTSALSVLSADHYRPWVNFHAEALAIAGIWTAFIGVFIERGRILLPRTWFWILAVTVIASGLRLFFSDGEYFGDFIIEFLYGSSFCAAMVVGIDIFRSAAAEKFEEPDEDVGKSSYALFFTVFLIAAILSSFVGFLQYLRISELLGIFVVHIDTTDRAMGNFAQANQQGTFLLMGYFCLLGLYVRDKISCGALMIVQTILVAGTILTQSRTALLIALAVLIATAVFYKRKPLNRGVVASVVIYVTTLWTGYLAYPWVSEWLFLNVGRETGISDSNGRGVVWLQTVAGVMKAPWIGYGFNHTFQAQTNAALEFPSELPFSFAHNIILDFIAWFGLPLGVGLGVALYVWAYRVYMATDADEKLITFFCLLPILVHSFLEFPFAYGYFLVLFGIFVGIAERERCQGVMISAPRGVVAIWASFVVILGVIVVWDYWKVEEDFRVTRFVNMRIGTTPEAYVKPDILVLNQMREMLAAARIRPNEGVTADELEVLRRVALRFPFGALTYRYANALARTGNVQAAKAQMQIIRGVYGEGYYTAVQVEICNQASEFPHLNAIRDPDVCSRLAR